MRHDISVDGYVFSLRPVRLSDAGFIVELRTDRKRACYLHPTSSNICDQEAWIEAYFARPGDYYFAVERKGNGRVEGFVGIYDVAPYLCDAEWGRWILRTQSLAAVESAHLVYRTAFNVLGLRCVHSRTISANEAVVSFHDSCGIRRSNAGGGSFLSNGVRFDMVEHRLTSGEWPEIDARLDLLVRKMAQRFSKY